MDRAGIPCPSVGFCSLSLSLSLSSRARFVKTLSLGSTKRVFFLRWFSFRRNPSLPSSWKTSSPTRSSRDKKSVFGGVDILASSRFVRWGPSSLVARTRFFAARTTTMMSKPPSRDVKKEPAVFISDVLLLFFSLSFCVSNKSVFSLLIKTF